MTDQEEIKGYLVEKKLGRGGMGEVFLVKDPFCSRSLALKIIREEMRSNPVIRQRFLQEAKIAARLTHPNIVSIYRIYEEEEALFYTMPYVQGETLKEILKKTREEQKEGKIVHPIGSSIPSLLRIFLDICEAIAYCHSQGVLHRDLKPDNIIIGTYGETLILDWGLACLQGESEEAFSEELPAAPGLTKPGKVPGTLSHMPPERAMGEKSSIKTDIFALGVILYQLLTLRLPFHRTTLPALRQIAGREKLYDPCEIAPYRDIPPFLGDITKKCMAFDPNQRYASVEKLIADIKMYIEGKPHWIAVAECSPSNPSDWLFQELIPTSSYKAVGTSTDTLEWIMLMLSRANVRGNFCIEATFKFKKDSLGIGFLFNTPTPTVHSALEESFSLWLTPKQEESCTLYHSRASVMESSIPVLKVDEPYHLRLEKIDQHIFVYLNEAIILNYLSHFPMTGDHIGFICKDFNFSLEKITLSSGTQRTMVSCLSIPDAFLSKRDFSTALSEYRKLASSFEGRSEGREALFRAGLTLLQEGIRTKTHKEKDRLFLLALDEFGKLRKSSGAPMEYLGKSIVYQAWGENEEEVKCLELAIRKYPSHPLVDLVIDQLLFRLYQSASKNRREALNFALLTIRLAPGSFEKNHHLNFLESIEKTLAFLLPLLPHTKNSSLEERLQLLTIQIAMVLDKAFVLLELLEKSKNTPLMENALLALLYLDHRDLFSEMLPLYEAQGGNTSFFASLKKALYTKGVIPLEKYLNALSQAPSDLAKSSYLLALQKSLLSKDIDKERVEKLLLSDFSKEEQVKILQLNARLFLKDIQGLKTLFIPDTFDPLTPQEAPLFLAYIGYLSLTEKKEKARNLLKEALKTAIDIKSFGLLRLTHQAYSKKELQNLLDKGLADDQTLISLRTLGHCLGDRKLQHLIEALRRLKIAKKSQ